MLGQQEVQLLIQIFASLNTISSAVTLANGASFSVPPYNSQAFTYVGGSNNIATQTFKLNGTTVSTLTFTYVGGGVSDDDLILTITQS